MNKIIEAKAVKNETIKLDQNRAIITTIYSTIICIWQCTLLNAVPGFASRKINKYKYAKWQQ